MDSQNNLNILESILFSCGEPVEIERIAEVMESEDAEDGYQIEPMFEYFD